MREIEFRGKSGEKWVYGFPLKNKLGVYVVTEENPHECSQYHYYRVIPETVGQYTGLKDKNGKKIFAGDFVMRRNTESTGIENEILHLVAFENGAFVMKQKDLYYPYRFAYEGYSMHKDYSMLQQFKKEAPWTNGSYEVIGNIHDNPELLESENGKEAAKCDCAGRCERCDPALRHND